VAIFLYQLLFVRHVMAWQNWHIQVGGRFGHHEGLGVGCEVVDDEGVGGEVAGVGEDACGRRCG
jgi:hypothetical protein